MFAELESVRLYYELHGDPSAPPLLLLHGATEIFRFCWAHQIVPFAARYRLIGVDLRGHGQSNNPADRLDLREMADDMAALLDYLGYESVFVCGHSGGASTALFLAVRHPERVRAMILTSNNVERDRARTEHLDFWNAERWRRTNPRWWARLTEWHRDPERLLRWWAEEDPQRPNFQREELAHLHMPVLVLNGDRDPVVPLSETLKLFDYLPNAALGIVPLAEHHLPRRRPETFNHLVLDFLARVSTP